MVSNCRHCIFSQITPLLSIPLLSPFPSLTISLTMRYHDVYWWAFAINFFNIWPPTAELSFSSHSSSPFSSPRPIPRSTLHYPSLHFTQNHFTGLKNQFERSNVAITTGIDNCILQNCIFLVISSPIVAPSTPFPFKLVRSLWRLHELQERCLQTRFW